MTELELGGNQLVTLPDSMAALTALKKLYLRDNKFATLPKPIVIKLTSLTKLDLGFNQLVTLPDSMAALTALETLRLSGNKFTTLPKPIVKLTSLTELDLRWNQLVTLPDTMAALTALATLYLNINPLVNPQSSAVEAWLTALEAGECEVAMPADGDDGGW